jgi:hypothetical protein
MPLEFQVCLVHSELLIQAARMRTQVMVITEMVLQLLVVPVVHVLFGRHTSAQEAVFMGPLHVPPKVLAVEEALSAKLARGVPFEAALCKGSTLVALPTGA